MQRCIMLINIMYMYRCVMYKKQCIRNTKYNAFENVRKYKVYVRLHHVLGEVWKYKAKVKVNNVLGNV